MNVTSVTPASDKTIRNIRQLKTTDRLQAVILSDRDCTCSFFVSRISSHVGVLGT